MLLPNHHSFTIVNKKTLKSKNDFSVPEIVQEEATAEVGDGEKRNFLKFLGGASVGAVVLSMIPSKAQAYIIGSSPTAGIVGVKNSSNVGVNPATEDGNLATLAAKDFATETSLNTLKNKDFATQTTLATRASESTLSAIKTNSDKFLFDGSGNLLTASTGGGSGGAVTVKDTTDTQINPATDENLILLRRILRQIDSLGVVDSSQRQKITIDSISGALTLANITTVGTVTTVSTVTTVGTVTTVTGVSNLTALGGVDGRYLYIDTARNMYATSIRSNLIYS